MKNIVFALLLLCLFNSKPLFSNGFTDTNKIELDTVFLDFERFGEDINLSGEQLYIVDSNSIILVCDVFHKSTGYSFDKGNYVLLPLEQYAYSACFEGYFTYGKTIRRLDYIYPYNEFRGEMLKLWHINYREVWYKEHLSEYYAKGKWFLYSIEHRPPKNFWGCINPSCKRGTLEFAKNKKELRRLLREHSFETIINQQE